MLRTIRLTIDESTWPGPGIPPLFPESFQGNLSPYSFSIPAMLLKIGYLTTPTSSTGISLSEFWAWVRYLAAISSDNDMRLTHSFSDLDAHQKTILSDDFGMGVPMLWLSDKLSLVQIVDGRYFMKRIAESIGATQTRTGKIGPNKTPDFVARDTEGKWHIIECKGTQSGTTYSDKQIGTKGPLLSGGVAQKHSIVFPTGYAGQRLVCGLTIGVEGGKESILKIVDPEPEHQFEFHVNELKYAEDAANRGVMSRFLRMAGFEITAESVASPFGGRPGLTRELPTKERAAHKTIMEERNKKSRSELGKKLEKDMVFDKKFRGREIAIELPRGISVNQSSITKVIIRYGINNEALNVLEQNPSNEGLVSEENADADSWRKFIGKTVVKTDGMSTTMQLGEIFRSEFIML